MIMASVAKQMACHGGYAVVVKLVMTILWMWWRGTPCGLQWCSKEATTHCWGLTGENRVRPVPCKNSSTA